MVDNFPYHIIVIVTAACLYGIKRQLRILRSPEASSECLKIMSKHDEKCACELHELKMKYEVEKLQTEHELREERTKTDCELRGKPLQTEDEAETCGRTS